jgi:hypothetical protein
MPGYGPAVAVPRPSGRSAVVFVLLLVLAVTVAPGGSRASVGSRLDDARARLRSLTLQIERQAAAIHEAQDRLVAADGRIAAATHRLGRLVGTRISVESALADAQAAYGAVQERLNRIAASTFMYTPGSAPDVVAIVSALDATSLSDLGDRITYAASLAARNDEIEAAITRARARLDDRARALDGVLIEQTALVNDLEAARQDKIDAVAAQQEALQAADAARTEIVNMIRRLHERLDGPDMARVTAAFQGDAHVSYGEWAGMFLRTVGAPACSDNMTVVVAWQVQEFTQAAWNPLATTHRMEGSTDFNSVGVQNFVSLEQGLQATWETIHNGWDIYRYGAIVQELRRCAEPMETATAVNASSWCRGCGNGSYLLGVMPRVEADYETYAAL